KASVGLSKLAKELLKDTEPDPAKKA
ncbi:MAG: hypothetical protein K0S44_3109, partial [Bacteroidetes bacterium]|nr:hypothetical protein [Bacteroidota bacterium]